MNVGLMLKEAMDLAGHTPKSMAVKCGYSRDMIYAALSEERPIPTQARPKISKMSLLAGLAVALEATGYERIFKYFRIDRHIQNLLQMVFKEDEEADAVLSKLPRILMNKNCADDLSEEDKKLVELAAKELTDRIVHDFNLLVELETKLGVKVMDQLVGKSKTAH